MDDDENVLLTFGTVLEDEGYDVETLPSGEAAVRRVAEVTFDLVLTDLTMPGVDGLRVLRAVKEHQPDTITVLLTGYASLESATEALRAGAYDYLTKPVQVEDMVRTIERGLEKRRLTRELERLDRLMNVGVDAALRSARNLPSALERIAHLLGEILCPAGGVLFLRTDARGERALARSLYAGSEEARRCLEAEAMTQLGLEVARGLEPILRALPGGSALAVPLEWKDQRHGALLVVDPADRAWAPSEVDTAVTIAGRAALAVENARLYQALDQDRRTLRRVLDMAGDGIVTLDEGSRVVLLSRAVERLTGLAEGDARGRPFDELLAAGRDGSEEGLGRLRRRARESEQGMSAGELALRGPSGEAIACDVVCSEVATLGDRSGVSCVLALRDARERLRREQQLTDAISQLTHELKSPLAAILGHVEVMRVKGEGSSRSLEVIRRNVVHLTTLIENMLATGRLSRGALDCSFESVPVRALVLDAHESFDPMARSRGLDLKAEVDGDPEVRGDRKLLTMALSNLILNAIKFTPSGGQVRIRARADDDGGTIITVDDSGQGIPEEYQERVFERYFQVRSDRGGTGLGLMIVRTVTEAHGGRVHVRSRLGEGSCFTLTLPKEGPAALTAGAVAKAGAEAEWATTREDES